MHHSSRPDPEMKRRLRSMFEGATAPDYIRSRQANAKLGATGKFPEGKLTEADEGEIQFRVGTTNQKVIIDFGQEVSWLGMDAKQARELANILYDHARALS